MEIGAFEAKNRLSALLDEVAKGGEVIITKRGKAVARLVPAEPGFDRERARRAAAGLREISRTTSLGGTTIRELIEEGRE